METLRQDLRFALRALRRRPGFALVAVLTLALGIGANSAIFSVVNGVLLRSLPFEEPDRLVRLYTAYPGDETTYPLSPPDFMSYHDHSRVFTDVAAVATTDQTLTGDGEPTQVSTALVSADFFSLLGVRPIIGRDFRSEENQPGQNEVVLLGHGLWQQRFGGDPAVIGRTLTLNGVQRTVIGVLPPGFDFPGERDVYYPLAYNSTFSSTTAEERRGEYLGIVARLRPGVSLEQAETDVRTLSDRLQQEFPETNSNQTISMIPLREQLLGEVRAPLLVLLGAVGLVLLIACANVANLLLARATAREGELAVRNALGAGRGRLIRQLLTESVVLGLLGGLVGLLLAYVGIQALIAARPEGIPRLEEIGLDATVVAFTAAISLGTGLVFGLIPAVQITRGGLSATLREGGRSGMGGKSRSWLRAGLVVGEMALAVMLLIGAGLLIRSFMQLVAVDPGFRAERVITFDVALPGTAYPEASARRAFYRRLLERMETLPGVQATSGASQLPLTGAGAILGLDVEGAPPPAPGEVRDAIVKSVTPDFLRTLGIPLRGGRPFTEQDREDAPRVLLANEAFVRRFFPGEDPLGRRVTFNGSDWAEIVGVVGDTRQYGLDQDVRPELYAPLAQRTPGRMTVVLRTSGDPLALTDAVRREVRALDSNLPVERFTTLDEIVDRSIAQPRFYMLLLTIFAAVALALAAVGIFGVMSFTVAQRTREIGIRVALGAVPSDVLALVVGRAMLLAVSGVVVGVAGALLLTRLMSSLLFGVGTTDLVTYLAVAVTLLAVATVASYLPARAATRVDPMTALRAE